MRTYKVLTLTQPWATLIALGEKKIETRSWSTSYRGPLLIHAAKGFGVLGDAMGLAMLCVKSPFSDVLIKHGVTLPGLPRGAIVAVCELVGCRSTPIEGTLRIPDARRGYGALSLPPPEPERSFGDYSPGRYAWILANIRALRAPIPARGALGLWEWTPPDGVVID